MEAFNPTPTPVSASSLSSVAAASTTSASGSIGTNANAALDIIVVATTNAAGTTFVARRDLEQVEALLSSLLYHVDALVDFVLELPQPHRELL